MERAATAFVKWFVSVFPEGSVTVVCGSGNNGGDGLAIARMLLERKYEVEVNFVGSMERVSPDCQQNYKRLSKILEINDVDSEDNIPDFKNGILIDAIFSF